MTLNLTFNDSLSSHAGIHNYLVILVFFLLIVFPSLFIKEILRAVGETTICREIYKEKGCYAPPNIAADALRLAS